MIFRHPVRVDRNGQVGLRVRRGLGTSEQDEALRLVEQMNEVLADKELWRPTQRDVAMQKYDARVVAAFYDDLAPVAFDGWSLRDQLLELPGREKGYIRVKLIGTTGSGKTTLVRQVAGTDPNTERFPSTSTAKTTTCDIELIMRDGDFVGVVSFLPKDQVRQFVEESVAAAVMAKVEGRTAIEVARKLLTHREQRFRLSYLLGRLGPSGDEVDEDLLDDDEAEQEAGVVCEVTPEEKRKLEDRLLQYLNSVQQLAESASAELAEELNFDPKKANREEKDFFEELLEEFLTERAEFHELADEIMDDCESRFDVLTDATLKRGNDKWPTVWSFITGPGNRADFIKTMNRFSSNHAPNFGRLLAPMVEGIRVAGPFRPSWFEGEAPRLVLLDGEGLGHTPASASSISTRITKRYELADVILLVDSAKQPMQAAPITVLNSLVSSGHESKLAICFTHFDDVRGDNLPDTNAKREHVVDSLDNAVAAVGKCYGHLAETALKEAISDRTVFMSNLDVALSVKAVGTKRQFLKLLDIFKSRVKPLEPSDFVPIYDDANLILLIQQAMEEFREAWRARLKLASKSSLPPEHWTRVKALSRHISQLGADEYDNLQPVAEFIGHLQSHVARFLSKPIEWDPNEPPTEDLINQSTAAVRQQVFQRLHGFARTRLIESRQNDWVHAFSAHRGRGSTVERSKDIEGIYNKGAPIPTGVAEQNANDFLTEVRHLVREAIEAGGGRLASGTRVKLLN
jgi:energy-coupling factor transporter ATP-binding protein EcfA2